MNSKIVSTILATAGVAVGVIGVTMGGAASSTPADCPTVPSMNAPAASGAANGAGAAVPATAVPGTENGIPATNTPSGTEGNGNGSGTAGNGGGLVSLGTDGSGNGSLIDVGVNPPSGATTPTLPSGGAGDLGGLAIDLDGHANPNQSNHPFLTANGSVDNR